MGRIAGYLDGLPLLERQAQGIGLAVLIGHSTPKLAVGQAPLLGKPGAVLARTAGLDYPDEYMMIFDRVNLLHRTPHGSALVACSEAAIELEPDLRGRVVIALGRSVALSFGLDAGYYSWNVVWLFKGRWRSIPWSQPKGERPFEGLEEEGATRGIFLLSVSPHPLRLTRFDRDPTSRVVDQGFYRSLTSKLRAQYAASGTPSSG